MLATDGVEEVKLNEPAKALRAAEATFASSPSDTMLLAATANNRMTIETQRPAWTQRNNLQNFSTLIVDFNRDAARRC